MSGALTFGSLFAGIGGIDLGFERAGLRCVWQCEFDEWCRGILARHWPDVPRYDDVRELSALGVRRPDVLVGGFPCQPFSLAGKRKAQDDPRHLWPYFARLVGDLRPAYVVGENVRGLCNRGLDEVLGDLAALGYDAEWQVVSAASCGAPHIRERVFIVAYAESLGERAGLCPDEPAEVGGRRPSDGGGSARAESAAHVADADGARSQRAEPQQAAGRAGFAECGAGRIFTRRPTPGWQLEPRVGRMAYGVPGRVDRLRGLGNAVVPAVAEYVGQLVVEDARRQGLIP